MSCKGGPVLMLVKSTCDISVEWPSSGPSRKFSSTFRKLGGIRICEARITFFRRFKISTKDSIPDKYLIQKFGGGTLRPCLTFCCLHQVYCLVLFHVASSPKCHLQAASPKILCFSNSCGTQRKVVDAPAV